MPTINNPIYHPLVIRLTMNSRILYAIAILLAGIIGDSLVFTLGFEAEIPAFVLVLVALVITSGSLFGIISVLKNQRGHR